MRPCKVCKSPNKHVYEDLIRVGVPLRKIVEGAIKEYKEEFSHMSLSRHYRNHATHNFTYEVKPSIGTPTLRSLLSIMRKAVKFFRFRVTHR